MATRLQSLRRRSNDERGAILVEFVLVIPLFMVLVLGIFEIGKAWESSQTVVQASRSGARTVSQLGTHSQADREALLAVASTFGADLGDIQRVVIFEADNNGDMPHPGCLNPNPPSSAPCNSYGPTQIAALANDSAFADPDGSGCSGGDYSDNWCPTDRDNNQRDATYVGVYVAFTEQYQTGFFGGGTYTLTETTVMRIEPDAD